MKEGKHYSEDPDRLKVAVDKSRATILERYGEDGISKKISEETKSWYKNQQQMISELEIVEKSEVCDFLKFKRDVYKGKSGNRKLIRDSPIIYKSLNHHCKQFEKFNYHRELPFLCMIDIANNDFTVDNDMLCLCGSILKFNKVSQNWDKFYCKKCRKSPTSLTHFKLKYGDNWEIKWKDFRENLPVPRGKNETHLLNQLEKIYNVSIDRRFTILDFFPDGYSKDLNIVFEINEKHHRLPSNMKKDNMRRHMIQKELKCDFVIMWDDTNEIDIHTYDEKKYKRI